MDIEYRKKKFVTKYGTEYIFFLLKFTLIPCFILVLFFLNFKFY